MGQPRRGGGAILTACHGVAVPRCRLQHSAALPAAAGHLVGVQLGAAAGQPAGLGGWRRGAPRRRHLLRRHAGAGLHCCRLPRLAPTGAGPGQPRGGECRAQPHPVERQRRGRRRGRGSGSRPADTSAGGGRCGWLGGGLDPSAARRRRWAACKAGIARCRQAAEHGCAVSLRLRASSCKNNEMSGRRDFRLNEDLQGIACLRLLRCARRRACRAAAAPTKPGAARRPVIPPLSAFIRSKHSPQGAAVGLLEGNSPHLIQNLGSCPRVAPLSCTAPAAPPICDWWSRSSDTMRAALIALLLAGSCAAAWRTPQEDPAPRDKTRGWSACFNQETEEMQQLDARQQASLQTGCAASGSRPPPPPACRRPREIDLSLPPPPPLPADLPAAAVPGGQHHRVDARHRRLPPLQQAVAVAVR